MTPNKPLLVLNASAGSGKTYNLVRNYLVLLLKEISTPDGQRTKADLGQIIAMTFTNKAAFEMKTRILRDLNKLANPVEKDAFYVSEICALVSQTPEELQKNARLILKKMLHRYEDFNVLTIDKFNLKLIRSFSRDLNLPEQFQVVLDEQMVLEKAVDELLNTIDKDEKNRLYKLAVNFATTNLDDENKWDVKKALIESAQILNDERSFQVIRSLIGKELTEADYELWKLQFKEHQTSVRSWQQRIQLAVEQSGLIPDQCSDKSRTWNKIQKLVTENGSTADKLKSFEIKDSFLGHLEKTSARTGNNEPYHTILQFADFWNRLLPEYYELEIRVKQFYLLSILRELAIFMEDIRSKDAIIRISEFNKLVAELVKDEEAPFIYERLGNRFKHFFLDEFQDTSRLQWNNLVPLVHESLSNDQFNLIVGDPKQSIYRFKNGVAEQFVALPGIYNPENDAITERKSTYFKELGLLEGLTENWRSAEAIVDFNNRFFENFISFLPESGVPYYNQVRQFPKGKQKGLIEFELVPKEDDATELVLSNLLKWVNACVEDGYFPNEICILAKRKSECNTYANHLKINGYQVISSDSLLVDSDQYVQFVMAFCRWRNQPNNLQLAMRFAELYFRLFEPETFFESYQECFVPRPENELKVHFSIWEFHRTSGFDTEHLAGGFQDLFSLIQVFIRALKIDELKNAYVHQLLDLAAQYDLQNGPDLAGFIAFYDKMGHKTNVQLPENKHSIRVMTAHKSKGLEFPVVIIPSVKFDTGGVNKKSYLVESSDHFVQTTLTTADKTLPILAPMVDQEKDAAFMDSVNLLYVAFTRPIDRLYFMGTLSSHSGALQKMIFDNLSQLFPEAADGKSLKFKLGDPPAIVHESEQQDAAFVPVSLTDFLWFPDISIMSEAEQEENDLHRQQRFGKQFHAIMEQSTTASEALTNIEKGILKGFIDTEFKEELISGAEKLFTNDPYLQLITNGVQLDERTLLIDSAIKLRPDKIILHPDKTIVVDFKTGERKPEHLTQVSQYMFALEMIKYPQIEGYLYYLNEGELIRVFQLES